MTIFGRRKREEAQPTPEEQRMRRQSAPQPTAQEYADRLAAQQEAAVSAQGAVDGFSAPISSEIK